MLFKNTKVPSLRQVWVVPHALQKYCGDTVAQSDSILLSTTQFFSKYEWYHMLLKKIQWDSLMLSNAQSLSSMIVSFAGQEKSSGTINYYLHISQSFSHAFSRGQWDIILLSTVKSFSSMSDITCCSKIKQWNILLLSFSQSFSSMGGATCCSKIIQSLSSMGGAICSSRLKW